MAKVILFGGGDGGGIIISRDGVQPIPPFDPALLRQLRALNELARATRTAHRSCRRPLTTVVKKLTSVVLKQIEDIAGEIDARDGVIYQSDDGGFTCGSTGQPPIPFPFPVDPRQTVEGLLDRGVVNKATMRFFEQAAAHKIDVFTAASDPIAAARKACVELTPEIEANIAELALDRGQPEDKVDREVIAFYQKVVSDGRYINQWVTNPRKVAEKLKMKASQAAFDRIVDIRDQGALGGFDPGTVMSPAAVAVAVAIVIVLWSRELELPVLDRSGYAKL